MEKTYEAGIAAIQRLIALHIHPAGQVLLFQLSKLVGLSRWFEVPLGCPPPPCNCLVIWWLSILCSPEKYGPLGLEERTILQAVTTLGVMLAQFDLLSTQLGKEVKLFHEFCEYLVIGVLFIRAFLAEMLLPHQVPLFVCLFDFFSSSSSGAQCACP